MGVVKKMLGLEEGIHPVSLEVPSHLSAYHTPGAYLLPQDRLQRRQPQDANHLKKVRSSPLEILSTTEQRGHK